MLVKKPWFKHTNSWLNFKGGVVPATWQGWVTLVLYVSFNFIVKIFLAKAQIHLTAFDVPLELRIAPVLCAASMAVFACIFYVTHENRPRDTG